MPTEFITSHDFKSIKQFKLYVEMIFPFLAEVQPIYITQTYINTPGNR